MNETTTLTPADLVASTLPEILRRVRSAVHTWRPDGTGGLVLTDRDREDRPDDDLGGALTVTPGGGEVFEDVLGVPRPARVTVTLAETPAGLVTGQAYIAGPGGGLVPARLIGDPWTEQS